MYGLGYALASISVVVDIHRGGVLLTLLGLAVSLVLTTLLLVRVARAMAVSPTAAQLAPAPLSLTEGLRARGSEARAAAAAA
jgi:hypothetical protein